MVGYRGQGGKMRPFVVYDVDNGNNAFIVLERMQDKFVLANMSTRKMFSVGVLELFVKYRWKSVY